MKQTRVATYSRVSGSGQNPEMQIKELQAYCRIRGWKIAAGRYCTRPSGAGALPTRSQAASALNHPNILYRL